MVITYEAILHFVRRQLHSNSNCKKNWTIRTITCHNHQPTLLLLFFHVICIMISLCRVVYTHTHTQVYVTMRERKRDV